MDEHKQKYNDIRDAFNQFKALKRQLALTKSEVGSNSATNSSAQIKRYYQKTTANNGISNNGGPSGVPLNNSCLKV